MCRVYYKVTRGIMSGIFYKAYCESIAELSQRPCIKCQA